VLIQALAHLGVGVNVRLDVYGISQTRGQDTYQEELITLAKVDPRITLKPTIPASQVIATLATYDLLVVPSQWLETGPLVVLEAFAAGVPVLGSRLGGIAELVEDGVNGLLVNPTSVEEWATAIQRLVDDRELLYHLRSRIVPPTDMKAIAQQMLKVYQRVLERN